MSCGSAARPLRPRLGGTRPGSIGCRGPGRLVTPTVTLGGLGRTGLPPVVLLGRRGRAVGGGSCLRKNNWKGNGGRQKNNNSGIHTFVYIYNFCTYNFCTYNGRMAVHLDVAKGLASGVGFGRVVCPDVRKKNNTHHNNKPSLLE